MKKNLIKSICLLVAIVLIGNIIGPSFAGLSDFDNGSFMTKAEFDSAFSDIYSRFTTLEANIDNKIDSQVVSSVEKCLDVKQSGYVGELLFGLTLRDNCLPLFDDTRDYKKTDYPELYATMSGDVNLQKLLKPGSSDAYFKLEDISDRYAKFGKMVDAGKLGDESLPNIKGNSNNNLINHQGVDTGIGALKYLFKGRANGMGGSDQPYGQMDFDASRGQVDGSGGFVSQANSTYKDGAKVNPDHIVVLPMIRYKLDKVQVDNKECPYAIGDIYQTTSSTNPATRWAGTVWERIADGNYIQFVGDGKAANQSLKAELPNAGGAVQLKRAMDTNINNDQLTSMVIGTNGGFKSTTSYEWAVASNETSALMTNRTNGFNFNLRDGQYKSDGTTFVSEAESVYKNGGEVRPKSITAYGWIRIS